MIERAVTDRAYNVQTAGAEYLDAGRIVTATCLAERYRYRQSTF